MESDLDLSKLAEEKEKVTLNRSWSFWENYETKNKEENDYSKLLKEIFSFNDIITFWQFWNNYPGSDAKQIFYNGDSIKYFFKEKYRIIAMNLFVKGIKPEWEDEKNKKGKTLILEYIINKDLEQFLSVVSVSWQNLMGYLIGETIPHSQNINGIRFVDKTKFGYLKNVIFKFEIWVNSSMEDKDLNELKEFLSKTFGCSNIDVRNIP
jgi:hypothetical protein